MKNSEYKEIIDKIVKEEKEEHNLDFDIHFIGKLTYFKNKHKILKKKFSLYERIRNQIYMLKAGGVQNAESNVIVIFSNYFKKKLFETEIPKLVFSLYHEIGHNIDSKRSRDFLTLGDVTYDTVAWYCDWYLFQNMNNKEKNNYYFNERIHDNIFFEITANKYAMEKTRQFFEKNKQYKLDEKYLDILDNSVQCQYNSFDLSKRLDIIINDYKNTPFFDTYLFQIFLNSDGSYKNLGRICFALAAHNDGRYYNQIDTRTIKGFLSTKTFRESLDLTKMSDNAKQYLLNLYGEVNAEEKEMIQFINELQGSIDSNEVKTI